LKVLQDKKGLIEAKTNSYGYDPIFATAIVFPEWIRYSHLFDLIEIGGLEWMYIQKGTQGADFSVGQCQMKPSFVEKLEAEVANSATLSKKFSTILLTGEAKHQRTQRLDRLQRFEWQWTYLMAFMAIMEEKWGCHYFSSESEKLSFYATCYNLGWDKSLLDIHAAMQRRSFPYGTTTSPSMQHNYAAVAVDFYTWKTATNP
jgi:hypothetical protein